MYNERDFLTSKHKTTWTGWNTVKINKPFKRLFHWSTFSFSTRKSKEHLGTTYGNTGQVVNLASPVRDMDCWLSYRDSVFQSVVAGSISSCGVYTADYKVETAF